MANVVVLEALRASSTTICGTVGPGWRIELRDGQVHRTNGFGVPMPVIPIPPHANLERIANSLCEDRGTKTEFKRLDAQEVSKVEKASDNKELVDAILSRVNQESKWGIIEGLGALDTYTFQEVRSAFEALVANGTIKSKGTGRHPAYYVDEEVT